MMQFNSPRLPMRIALALAALLAAPVALAQSIFSNGTYVVEGGSYSIDVVQEGNSLVVVEPNKRSQYVRQGDGTYHFYNPNTETNYGIRVLNDHMIEAFKPGQPGNVPTRLARLGGPPAPPAAAPAPAPAPAAASDGDGYGAVAERYRQLSLDDPDNAQTWTACAAAALKRSNSNIDEADAYGIQMAQVLSLMLVDSSRTPCADAIPPGLWKPGATAAKVGSASEPAAAADDSAVLAEAERGRLARLNELADARVQAAQAEAEQRRKEQIAYEQKLAETKAAAEKFARDQAAHEAELAKARAAAADYQRKLEEHRRLIASGKFADPK